MTVSLHFIERYCQNLYLSVDPIFQSLQFLSEFPWYMFDAYKEDTEPKIPIGEVEVIISKVKQSPL